MADSIFYRHAMGCGAVLALLLSGCARTVEERAIAQCQRQSPPWLAAQCYECPDFSSPMKASPKIPARQNIGLGRCSAGVEPRKIEMTRSSSVFRQVDVARALKAVQAAKVPISGVEITADGTIRVLVTPEAEAPASPFDAWKSKH